MKIQNTNRLDPDVWDAEFEERYYASIPRELALQRPTASAALPPARISIKAAP